MKNVLFTPISANSKTGPIATSTQNEETCPASCPFLHKGCYSRYGPSSWHWNRLNAGTAGIPWKEFLLALRRLHRGAMFRYSVAGDLPGVGDKIDKTSLGELVAACKDRLAFTFTHKPVLSGASAAANRAAIKGANEKGFVVNLSGNNLAHADKLKALKIGPVVCVVPDSATANTVFTPAGNKVIICPAQSRENVTCATCRLCANQKRSVIIGFRPHGMGAKHVRPIAAQGRAVTV